MRTSIIKLSSTISRAASPEAVNGLRVLATPIWNYIRCEELGHEHASVGHRGTRLIDVLLLGAGVRGFTHLAHWLGAHGRICSFASSFQDALGILREDRCILVLSTIPSHQASA